MGRRFSPDTKTRLSKLEDTKRNRHFPTIPEAPQYPPRPHQPQNRIKSRGVVQPAANCRPPPPSPPQHEPKSPQSAIRRKISFRRPKPGDCEFGARKGRAKRSRCPINTPAMHPGKAHFRPLNPMIAHRKSRGTTGANGPNPNPSQATLAIRPPHMEKPAGAGFSCKSILSRSLHNLIVVTVSLSIARST